MKWRKCSMFGGKCYQADLFLVSGCPVISIWVYKAQDAYWINAHGVTSLISHKKLKKAKNMKDAAKIAKKRIKTILNNWLDLLN